MKRLLVICVMAGLAVAPTADAAGTAPTAVTGSGGGSLSCSDDIPSHLSLAGTVNPNGQDTTWYFEYGADTSYGTQTPTQDAGSGIADVPVSQDIAGVTAGMIHFRLVAMNAGGPAYGLDNTAFVAVPPCPAQIAQVTVTAGAPKANRPGCGTKAPTFAVVLSATVTPIHSSHEVSGSAIFQYGSTTQYGHAAPPLTVPWSSATTSPTTVSTTISGLPFGVTHYRLVVNVGDGGMLTTADQTISTPAPPLCGVPIFRTRRATVAWSLVRLSHHRHTAVIRFQPPCGATSAPAHVTTTRLRHHHVRIAVTMKVRVPASTCITLRAPQRRTIHLPPGTSPGQLAHAR